jgi:hypothetical protein
MGGGSQWSIAGRTILFSFGESSVAEQRISWLSAILLCLRVSSTAQGAMREHFHITGFSMFCLGANLGPGRPSVIKMFCSARGGTSQSKSASCSSALPQEQSQEPSLANVMLDTITTFPHAQI